MDLYQRVHNAAKRRLEEAEQIMDAEYEGEEYVDPSPLAGPYDGCFDCIVREVLDAARPYFGELAVAEGQVNTPLRVVR